MSVSVIKPFVTSDVCLQCDGCCRFKEEKSAWRPRFSTEESSELTQKGLAEQILNRIASDGRIAAKPCGIDHSCSFFNSEDHTCGIYTSRPFECQLYPFVMTKKNGRDVLSVHLSCPFVQEKLNTDYFTDYVGYLKDYFAKPETSEFIRKNPEVVGDYLPYQDELESLFALDAATSINQETALLDKKELIESYLKKETHELSSFAFVNIFIWGGFFDFDFELIDGKLCIFAKNELGTFLYLPPLGVELQSQTIEACFNRMETQNRGSAVSRIENVPAGHLRLFPDEKFSLFQKASEFVYLREDLVDLKGNTYKSKRSSFNQFAKREDFQFLPYESEHLQDCLDLYQGWMNERKAKNNDPIYQQMLSDSEDAHRRGMTFSKELGLIGRVVLIEGEIKGYTFGYPLNPETFCVLFEATDLSIKGLSTFIFSRFCSDSAVVPYQWINVMDDFELKNIETAKLSFRPQRQVPSYTISRRN